MTLGRPHQDADGGRGLAVRGGVLVEGVVDPQHRRDAGGADVEDPGVGDLTVDLHHHLEVFSSDDGICGAQEEEGVC